MITNFVPDRHRSIENSTQRRQQLSPCFMVQVLHIYPHSRYTSTNTFHKNPIERKLWLGHWRSLNGR